jgi:hypothetical protein
MANLAVTLGNQGKLDEAALMKKKKLEKRKRILGEEYPDAILAKSKTVLLGDLFDKVVKWIDVFKQVGNIATQL